MKKIVEINGKRYQKIFGADVSYNCPECAFGSADLKDRTKDQINACVSDSRGCISKNYIYKEIKE